MSGHRPRVHLDNLAPETRNTIRLLYRVLRRDVDETVEPVARAWAARQGIRCRGQLPKRIVQAFYADGGRHQLIENARRRSLMCIGFCRPDRDPPPPPREGTP